MRWPHRWHTAFALLAFRAAAYRGASDLAGPSGLADADKEMTMNIARKLSNWRKYRETVTELDRMTDRELHDLGIGRSDIRRVARTAVGF